eukprot:1379987-Alexandrium_andersonii.AAC.1
MCVKRAAPLCLSGRWGSISRCEDYLNACRDDPGSWDFPGTCVRVLDSVLSKSPGKKPRYAGGQAAVGEP